MTVKQAGSTLPDYKGMGTGYRGTTLERFERSYCPEPMSGCWLWESFLMQRGYGLFWLGGRNMRAHRASWILHKREIPDGLQVLHHCDTRSCVNPEHLFLGTAQDNSTDMVSKGRSMVGVRHMQVKLSESQVRRIYNLRGKVPLSALAKRFSVDKQTIWRIHVGLAWSHLTGETR